jgi:nitrous oxidase accessory protein
MTQHMKISVVLLLISILPSFVSSQTTMVNSVDQLQSVLKNSANHDTIFLATGTYATHIVIDKPITLTSSGDAILDAQGIGNAITITSDDVTVSNLIIQNYGDDLTESDSGIKVIKTENTTITHNSLTGDGFGIYVDTSNNTHINHNKVTGNADMRSSDRGNGIHLTSVKNALVEFNNVIYTRDGLYIINSQNSKLMNNKMTDLRFGVHYMYSYHNEVSNNIVEDVDVGYALMSSKYLTITNNKASRCEDYGLLLNFVNYSTFTGNVIDQVNATTGTDTMGDEGKALFVYNSTNNKIIGNQFSNSQLGIHLTAGSEGNELYRNNFINNEVQVKYVSSREQEWSFEQQGNYWSNYLGWDLDQDGIGDTSFEPNDGVDKLIWKYPEAKVLMDSPAVLLLRWVQRSFPVLKSPGVKDSYPVFHPIGAQVQ